MQRLFFFLRLVLTAAIGFDASARCCGAEPLLGHIHTPALPVAVMALVALFEFVAVIALWFRPLSIAGSMAVALMMFGAAAAHLQAGHNIADAAPSIGLAVACVVLMATALNLSDPTRGESTSRWRLLEPPTTHLVPIRRRTPIDLRRRDPQDNSTP